MRDKRVFERVEFTVEFVLKIKEEKTVLLIKLQIRDLKRKTKANTTSSSGFSMNSLTFLKANS